MIITFKSKLLLLIQLLIVFALSPLALLFIVPPMEVKATKILTIDSIKSIDSINSIDSIKSVESVARIGVPVRLFIPQIGVDASFEHVEFSSTGAMGTPKGPSNVAWFENGPRPGERGSAVVNGHYGWRDGIPAVFDSLNMLKKGDRIYIEDDKGESISFIVTRLETYGEKEEAFGVFNSTDGKAHLNIITCEGKWNAATQRYSDRLVVFSDRE